MQGKTRIEWSPSPPPRFPPNKLTTATPSGRVTRRMREKLICKGCGAEVEVDRSFVVRVIEDPHPHPSTGLVTTYEGNIVVHECDEGTYGDSRSHRPTVRPHR